MTSTSHGVPTVDKVLESFPIQQITPIVGEPNYETINELARNLKTNAASIVSERGGGILGHLALVVPPAAYLTMSNGAPFDIPANPGPLFIPPANRTVAQLEKLFRATARLEHLHKRRQGSQAATNRRDPTDLHPSATTSPHRIRQRYYIGATHAPLQDLRQNRSARFGRERQEIQATVGYQPAI